MTTLLSALAASATLALGALALAPRAELVTEIDIAATPAEVWRLLENPSGYGEWNSFIISMEGELVEGAKLVIRMRPQDGSEITLRPTVLKAEPARELRWLGRLFLLPRIFDGEHYFLLEEREGGTRLVHGEKFRGVLLWFIDVRQFRPDLERMNMELKKRVELSEEAALLRRSSWKWANYSAISLGVSQLSPVNPSPMGKKQYRGAAVSVPLHREARTFRPGAERNSGADRWSNLGLPASSSLRC